MSIPELADVTPDEARLMVRSPERLQAWLTRMGISRIPAGFFGALASLSWIAEDAEYEATAAMQQAATRSAANSRRKDGEMLRTYVEASEGRLPSRLKQVFALCIEDGRTIAEVARALQISPSTVREHLRRLREVARRHEAHRPAH